MHSTLMELRPRPLTLVTDERGDLMKEKYEDLEMETIEFEASDLICTSNYGDPYQDPEESYEIGL